MPSQGLGASVGLVVPCPQTCPQVFVPALPFERSLNFLASLSPRVPHLCSQSSCSYLLLPSLTKPLSWFSFPSQLLACLPMML